MCRLTKFFCLGLLLILSVGVAKSQNPLNDIELARQFYSNGEYDKSIIVYERLLKTNPDEDFYFDEYFNTLLKLKKYSDAEKLVAKKIKTNFKYGINLGQLYQEKGEIEKANKAFEAVLTNMPEDELAINGIANSFYSVGNYDYAIKAFLIGRKILKDDHAFSFELINFYRFKKQKLELTEEILNVITHQPSFLANAKATLTRTYDQDEDYWILKSLLLKKIQKDAQNTSYVNLLAWAYLQQKQYELALVQLIALDKRTEDNGGSIYNFANILTENKAYTSAEKAYAYLLTKQPNSPYFIASKVALLQIKNQQIVEGILPKQEIEQLAIAYEDLLKTYGENTQSVFAMSALANLKAFYLDKTDEASLLLEKAIGFPNLNAEIAAKLKLDLAAIYILNSQPWDAALLYGQIEKSFKDHPLGQQAKFRNAKLSFYKGDFNWAKAQLDVLKASTSQLIANDALDLSLLIQDDLAVDSTGNALKFYARADLLRLKNKPLEALETLDSLKANLPATTLLDDVLMLKADIYIEQRNYQLAKNTLNSIVADYASSIWADDALFDLGILEEDNLRDLESAKRHYEALINNYPGSLYLIEARKRFRNLRGDAPE